MFKLLFWLALSLTLAACGDSASRSRSTATEVARANATAAAEPERPPGVRCDWARVRSVTDGDTIRVDFATGAANQAVRYIGMDTPETVHPTLGVQPFGPEASARNKALVGGKRVCLERDISEMDRYGRLLRYAWLEDGRLVNEVLVEEGLAVIDTFPPDVRYVERFLAAQLRAREGGRGLWAEME